jgi:hypothetical protein
VRQRRDGGNQLGRDVLSRDEQLLRLQARGQPGINEVFALDREQPQLVPPAPVTQLANQLQPRIRS